MANAKQHLPRPVIKLLGKRLQLAAAAADLTRRQAAVILLHLLPGECHADTRVELLQSLHAPPIPNPRQSARRSP